MRVPSSTIVATRLKQNGILPSVQKLLQEIANMLSEECLSTELLQQMLNEDSRSIDQAFHELSVSRGWNKTIQAMYKGRLRVGLSFYGCEFGDLLIRRNRKGMKKTVSDTCNVDADACIPASVRYWGRKHWLYAIFESVHARILRERNINSHQTGIQYNSYVRRYIMALVRCSEPVADKATLTEDELVHRGEAWFRAQLAAVTHADACAVFRQAMTSSRYTTDVGQPISYTDSMGLFRTRRSVFNLVCSELLSPERVPRPAAGPTVGMDMMRRAVADPRVNKFLGSGENQRHQFFSEAEEAAIHAACVTPLETMVMAVLFTTGMRISGLLNLRVDGVLNKHAADRFNTEGVVPSEADVSSSGATMEKNNRVFQFVIFPHVRRAVAAWLGSEACISVHSGGPYLIASPRVTGSRCSMNHLRKIFQDVCRVACPGRQRAHPHMARHTVAERLYQEGNSVVDIARYLQHSPAVCNAFYLRRPAAETIATMKFPWSVQK